MPKTENVDNPFSTAHRVGKIGQKITGKLRLVQDTNPDECFLHKVPLPCHACNTRERLQREQEEAEERAARAYRREHPEMFLKRFGIGEAMLKCSFEAFQGGEGTKAILRECLKNKESVVLIGNTGAGKSHLAVAMLKELLVHYSTPRSVFNACFVTVPELLMEIRDAYRDGGSEEAVVNKYARYPYLVLDDIGAEKSSPWSVATLYILIDRRCREMLPTVYTTNLTFPEIEAYLGPRIASRMSTARIITLELPDYRRRRTP